MNPDNLFSDCVSPTEAVFQAIGAGSVCWDHMEGAGVFQSDQAKKVAEDLIDRLQELFDLGLGW